MNSFARILILILIVSLPVLARGDYAPGRLLVAGHRDQLWLAVIRTDESKEAAQPTLTTLRLRTDPIAGSWSEVGSLQADMTDLAAIGMQCAVLLDNGDWKLFSGGGSTEGAELPDGWVIKRLGTSGDDLLAIAERSTKSVATSAATQPDNAESSSSAVSSSSSTEPRPDGDATTRPAEGPVGSPTTAPTTSSSTSPTTLPAAPAGKIFRWNWSSWQAVGDLPDGVTASSATAVGGVGDVVYLLTHSDNALQISRFENGQWQDNGSITQSPGERVKFLSSDGGLYIAILGVTGWQLYTITGEQHSGAAVEVSGLSDTTFVGPTWRTISIDNKGKLEQISVDQLGRGQRFGPIDIKSSWPARTGRQSWNSLIVLGLLTLTMLLTLRQKPTLTAQQIATSQDRLAPLTRRLLAGIVDFTPVIGTMFYLFRTFERGQVDVNQLDPKIMFILYASFGVYLLHVTIGEIILGRSVGKLLFGLRVSTIDAEKASPGRIVLRNLLRLIELAAFGLPLLLVLMTPLRQRIGDMAARTIVVTDTPATPPDEQNKQT